MIPEGSDAISPAPHHDIYSIEDLRQLICSLKEATQYRKPVIVKVAAVHNIAATPAALRGAARTSLPSTASGAAPAPRPPGSATMWASPLSWRWQPWTSGCGRRASGNQVSLIAGGSIRSSADVVKAVALGADACYIGTAALIAMGCHLCRTCQSGRCAWGIATQRPELVKRLDPDEGTERLINLMTAWKHEIMETWAAWGSIPSRPCGATG